MHVHRLVLPEPDRRDRRIPHFMVGRFRKLICLDVDVA